MLELLKPFQFGQPCGPFQFACRPFTVNQPCSPFVFNQPCSPFIFGGSQCGVPGGFACGGQQFVGLVGAPAGPVGQKPPLSPLDFSVKEAGQEEDKKETKE